LTQSVREALAAAQAAGLDRPDSHALLQALLQRPRSWLIAHDDALLAPDQATQFATWIERRAAGEPVAYLLGQKEFYGLALEVTPATLVPRPDTETLVDWALERLPAQASLLDMGTGSGAIALAVKHSRPDAIVCATDASPAALAVAQRNGERLGLSLEWLLGSWWEPLVGRCFDLIVSNPPYIAEGDSHLPALRHEPLSALTAGPDGLDDLRTLISGAAPHLHPGGWLLLEHGYDQADAVAALFAAQPAFAKAEHRLDLGGHRRCTGAQVR
jgi:release factor glutamine methyltransferase